jgi:hypothetical protein
MTVWRIDHIRRMMAGLALVAITLLGGCLAESEHPIAAADPAKNDPRLWGSWKSEEEDGYVVAHVFATEADSLHVSIAEHGVEGMGHVDTYDAHVTQLPTGDYLNVKGPETEDGYVFVKYKFTGSDHLTVWSMENEKVVEAVKDGKLPGTTKQEGNDVDVRITATSKEWQAFLAKVPAEFFGDPMEFERVGPAYVEQQ